MKWKIYSSSACHLHIERIRYIYSKEIRLLKMQIFHILLPHNIYAMAPKTLNPMLFESTHLFAIRFNIWSDHRSECIVIINIFTCAMMMTTMIPRCYCNCSKTVTVTMVALLIAPFFCHTYSYSQLTSFDWAKQYSFVVSAASDDTRCCSLFEHWNSLRDKEGKCRNIVRIKWCTVLYNRYRNKWVRIYK